jgi:hypothetical protein
VSFVASWESIEKTKDGQLAFANKRAEVWWKFPEALDPDQPDGSSIACRLILNYVPTFAPRRGS